MPKLTVRSLAELIEQPAYAQVRTLYGQKYPKAEPQCYKLPYYALALNAIRRFYRLGNNIYIIDQCRENIENKIKQLSKRQHNLRVVNAFQNSAQFARLLAPQSTNEYTWNIGVVELRLSCDLFAKEDGKEKIIFYNVRNEPIEEDIARLTLEIAGLVLRNNSVQIPQNSLEYIDLFTQQIFRGSRIRKSTESKVQANIDIIETLWPTI